MYIYDILLCSTEVSNPIYPFLQIKKDTVSHITPILYRIQQLKHRLMTQTGQDELLHELESESEFLYSILIDHDVISRKAGTKRFSYIHRWIQEKLVLLDMFLDTVHTEHTSGGLSAEPKSVFTEIEQNDTLR